MWSRGQGVGVIKTLKCSLKNKLLETPANIQPSFTNLKVEHISQGHLKPNRPHYQANTQKKHRHPTTKLTS